MSGIKALSVVLTECSEETGYEYDVLVNRVEELINSHDFDWNNAVEYICELAYEGEL